jgi:outer membrane protein OmpA-like peptidoglycan-associated protein
MIQLKPGGKILLLLLIGVGIFFGAKWWLNRPKDVAASQSLGSVAIPDVPEASLSGTSALKLPLPGTDPALNGGLRIDHYEMAWAAQTSFNYANGGERTTKNSLFDKAGLDVKVIRQDDDSKSQQLMAKWIKDYHDGVTKDGMIITDMGSQMDSYLKTINDLVEPLGPEYQAVIFGAIGKSYGEDQLIGDIKYKTNPQLLKGAVMRGVRLGGDLDIALKFAGDNGVPVNQDEKLYDPNALNLSYGSDFLSVVNDYNSNQKETRKIVRNGKTGADTTVGFDLVATWTPGDVNAIVGAEGITPRGGATIISTRQYTSIMPAVMISCRKFLNDNTSKIQDMLAALAQAGDQVRSFEDVKEYALGLDAKMWNEKDQAYWTKYYNGLQNGNAHLGGSMVYNLKDVANEFGLQGTSDIYKEVYNTFKDIHGRLYGKELAGVPDYGKAVDKSYMAAVVANHPELLEGKALVTQYATNITTKVASKNVQINFETGSAKISPSSYATLDDIYTNAVSAEGLKVGVYGYTDNVGSPDKNQTLSEARAESVKQYLLSKGLSAARIESKGFGQQQPVADNGTAEGRAQNRRVEIALGN